MSPDFLFVFIVTVIIQQFIRRHNTDPELRPWNNTSSSAITRSRRRVHRPLHISWQWYPLVWAFHPRDTQANRSSFKYFQQTRQRLGADRIEFTDEDTALQVYNALVISVLLYGSETWTLLEADERWLEAFHMNCQRRILGIRWFHFARNASVTS